MGHRVKVITRASNRHTVEAELSGQAEENISFIFYDLPSWILRWRKYPGGKIFYYVLWQWFAVRRVRELFPDLPFDAVQHVTYVSARYPSFMGLLGIPFCFGPVSGGEGVPPGLRSGFSAGQQGYELLRDVSNFLVKLDPLMRQTFRRAQSILVTRDTRDLVPRRWRSKVKVRLAVGLSDPAHTAVRLKPYRSGEPFQLLYVGRLVEYKGVDLALQAMAKARQVRPVLRLTIVGDGPAKANLQQLAIQLGLEDSVHWISWLPQRVLAESYDAADLLLFPGLRDSGGMVVLEALAHGLPVVCADLGGPGLIVNHTCGRALATLGRSPQQLACDIADALDAIVSSPDLHMSLRLGARLRARQFVFSDLVRSVYPSALPQPMACKS